MTPKEVIKFAKEKGAKIVDLRFIDLPGLWQHFSIPAADLTEGPVCRGYRIRRIVDSRIPGDRRV